MAQMLRHIETGEVFPMNPDLARHDAMQAFDPVNPMFADAAAEQAAKDEADAEAIAAAEAASAKKPAPKKKAAPKKRAAPKTTVGPDVPDVKDDVNLDDIQLDD